MVHIDRNLRAKCPQRTKTEETGAILSWAVKNVALPADFSLLLRVTRTF